MKKFFAVILFALVVLSDNAKVNADVNKDAEEVKQLNNVIKISQAAFLATDDYARIINNGQYAVATGRITTYKKISEKINAIAKSSPVGNVQRCAWLAEMIINERFNAMESFVNALNCHSVGDENGYKFYAAKMKYSGARANELRNIFFYKYHI